MRSVLLTRLMLLIATTIMVMTIPINAAESEDQSLYLKLLKYEYDNRTFAYLGMKKAAHVLKDEPAGVFYQAYYDLEVVNQQIYKRSAVALNFDYKASWFTKFRGHAGGFAAHFITFSPESLIKIIVPYIPKLEQLRDLADPRYQSFFAYIVAQEKTQLEASQIAKAEGWEQGAKVLRAFVDSIDVDNITVIHGDN
ncbi:hypothetical protein OAT92_08585 [Porticoccaceae bacterium]|nr:hypothetical protein [Porticoccaceae bacterium]MBT7564545.1 hypothetical protein [Porticoccaceae bacterium]MBT7946342.1 hypothetical protein [Porticoccaceae bacterium]MDB2565633.1 hypothetical protein [Porticoccaceae bacterium]MDB2621412.1 hypothetical protein [Porticoccaceae bacterium]